MQKKIIAVAVATLVSGAAFAQSNVTVYGKLDQGYAHSTSVNGTKSSQIASIHDSSKIGFKGEEALGNGMKAIFQAEFGFTPDANTGLISGKDTFVGLTGNFGTLIAGKLTGPGSNIGAGYDAADNSNLFSPGYTMHAQMNGATSTFWGQRLNNAVAYVAPVMGGVTLTGAYSFAGARDNGGTAADTTAYAGDQERILGLTAVYDNGPLSVGYGYHAVNDYNMTQGADQREHIVGGSYDLGVVKFMGSYQTLKFASLKDKMYNIGAIVPTSTNGQVRIAYAHLSKDGGSANDSSSYALRYDYALSKRTSLNAAYIHANNDSGAVANVTSSTLTGGESNSMYGFGVIHSF